MNDEFLFRLSICVCGLLPIALPADGAESRKPNIIVIFCDDLGYGDLGCYGAADIRTPHLDRMAKEGMLLTDFSMVAPLCTPSRAAFMTGRYPGRMGLATGVLRPNAKTGMPPQEITLGEVAKSAGYATGLIGKWHLGFVPGMLPRDQGFDTYFGVLHNLDHYETRFFEAEGGMPVLRGDTVVERPAEPSRITSLYTDEALRFIDHHRKEPFFLFISHQMPHLPFDASPAFKGRSRRGLYGDVVEELDDSTGRFSTACERTSCSRTRWSCLQVTTAQNAIRLAGRPPARDEAHGVRGRFASSMPGLVARDDSCGLPV